MRYYIITDEKRRSASTGLIPVQFLFKYNAGRFVITSRIGVKFKFKGLSLNAKETNAKAKTRKLVMLTEEIDRELLESDLKDINLLKRKLKIIITGEEQKIDTTLADYIKEFASIKKKEGTQNLYLLTARKVSAFDASASFTSVDSRWLDDFVASLGDVSTNYISIHLRNLRSVFNWAIDNELTDKYPFRKYKIKSEKVKIRNISVDELRSIRDFPVEEWQKIYRDMFMLSFYLCGINPIDLLNLKHSDLNNGRISYKRAKTGRLYDVPVFPEAMEIIKRYKGKKYLLCPMDNYANYKDFCHHWNSALKKIGKVEVVADKTGKLRKHVYNPIVKNITIYTARYTFASIGAELDIPRETIALCLGHAWTDVTSHYINYDLKKIDNAVKDILSYIDR